ncbi:MAG: hypothetical protein KTR26_13055 [Flammeovirgaceae bacterium]|nr:hypothetical protein [Flammeovirgaceae bacterium]
MKLESEKVIILLSLLGYIGINIFMMFYHEPWRDELQAISLSKNSNSLASLVALTKYEGHPSLWFFILFFASKLSDSLIFIQILHLAIFGVGVFILLKYSKVDLKLKIPIIFGYYFMYEYSIIIRNYGIGITLLLLACFFIDKKKLILSSIIIAILFHANIYAFFLGASLWFTVIIHFFTLKTKKIIIGTVILFFSFILLVLDILPPEDHFFATEHLVDFRNIMKGFTIIWKSFISIPEFDVHFWNSNVMKQLFTDKYFSNAVMVFGSSILLIYSLNYLGKSSSALIFFCTVLFIITFFSITKYHGYLRHQGHLFIAYIVAIWLKEIFPQNQFKQFQLPISETFLSKFLITSFFKKYFIQFVLFISIIGSIISYYFDLNYQFSNGKKVATYIKENYSSNCNVIGHVDFSASTISYFLDKDIYYPLSETSSSFIVWDIKRDRDISEKLLLSGFNNEKTNKKETILITSFEIENKNLLEEYKLTLVKEFEPAIVENESFYLYQ